MWKETEEGIKREWICSEVEQLLKAPHCVHKNNDSPTYGIIQTSLIEKAEWVGSSNI